MIPSGIWFGGGGGGGGGGGEGGMAPLAYAYVNYLHTKCGQTEGPRHNATLIRQTHSIKGVVLPVSGENIGSSIIQQLLDGN